VWCLAVDWIADSWLAVNYSCKWCWFDCLQFLWEGKLWFSYTLSHTHTHTHTTILRLCM